MTKTKVVTRRDMAEFVACLCNGLNPPPIGAPVSSYDIVGLHSDGPTEDGKRLRFYDLESGRTGMQIGAGAILYAD